MGNTLEDLAVLVSYQNKLLEIIHAINCSVESSTGCLNASCDRLKLDLVHAAGCLSPSSCEIRNCGEVSVLLAHWTTCNDWNCLLCKNVWEPNKNAEYEIKLYQFDRVKSMAAAILNLIHSPPRVTSDYLKNSIIQLFNDIDYSDYEEEVNFLKFVQKNILCL